CPITNEEDEQTHSSDDQDEPLIVATVPPLVQDSSNYRVRQDIYDDETGDDQQSNSSSLDYSPIPESEPALPVQSPIKSTITITPKSNQFFNESGNETIHETSVDIPTMATKRSTCLLSGENIQETSVTIEESIPERTKATKNLNSYKTSEASNSSCAISIDQNQTNDTTSQTASPSLSTNDDATRKPTTSTDAIVSTNKQSQNINDQSK
ncbi:unnamed protein product, partial [Rotaria magnacalcarata]